MANVSGIAIVIKAFLPTGKTLDEQFAALSIVKAAHETGDYSALLKAANVDSVLTEQKTRRIEDAPLSGSNGTSASQSISTETSNDTTSDEQEPEPELQPDPPAATDADVPEFLKKDKKSKAA